MRLYVDVCCLQRPRDDQSQPRVRLESEAVRELWAACARGERVWVTSPAVELEIAQTPDEDRRLWAATVIAAADECSSVADLSWARWRQLIEGGLRRVDALHVAFAEAARCDILFTTDDQLERRAATILQRTGLRAVNRRRFRPTNAAMLLDERASHGRREQAWRGGRGARAARRDQWRSTARL